jgi:hypothetical protein
MAHLFRAKSFITDASAVDDSTTASMAGLVENYLEAQDAGGDSADIDEIICVTSCKLKGDRVFTLVVLEDQVAGG